MKRSSCYQGIYFSQFAQIREHSGADSCRKQSELLPVGSGSILESSLEDEFHIFLELKDQKFQCLQHPGRTRCIRTIQHPRGRIGLRCDTCNSKTWPSLCCEARHPRHKRYPQNIGCRQPEITRQFVRRTGISCCDGSRPHCELGFCNREGVLDWLSVVEKNKIISRFIVVALSAFQENDILNSRITSISIIKACHVYSLA